MASVNASYTLSTNAPHFSEDVQRVAFQIHQDIRTVDASITLRDCVANCDLSTGGGAVSIERGDFVGKASTMSGEVSVRDCKVQGSISTWSGTVRVRQNASVSTNFTAIETMSGAVELDGSKVRGNIKSGIGRIEIIDSTVQGDVETGSADITVQTSRIYGTLYATAPSLTVGRFSHVDKIVMRGTHGPRLALQTIRVGRGTTLKAIEFDAVRCHLVLGRQAAYLGDRPNELTIEVEEEASSSAALVLAGGVQSELATLPDLDFLIDPALTTASVASARRISLAEAGSSYIERLKAIHRTLGVTPCTHSVDEA